MPQHYTLDWLTGPDSEDEEPQYQPPYAEQLPYWSPARQPDYMPDGGEAAPPQQPYGEQPEQPSGEQQDAARAQLGQALKQLGLRFQPGTFEYFQAAEQLAARY